MRKPIVPVTSQEVVNMIQQCDAVYQFNQKPDFDFTPTGVAARKRMASNERKLEKELSAMDKRASTRWIAPDPAGTASPALHIRA